MRGKNSANRVQVDNHEDLLGSHPYDSVEVISDEDLASDQLENPQQGLTVCHIAIMSGILSSDKDNYCSDSESGP